MSNITDSLLKGTLTILRLALLSVEFELTQELNLEAIRDFATKAR